MDSSEFTYGQRVERLVLSVIDIDIPAITPIEYETQLKLKKLLVVLSEQVPFVPNMTSLSRDVEVTRNQLMKFFTLLSEGAILRTLMDATTQPKRASKPEKILFDNPSVMQALGIIHKTGTVRESLQHRCLVSLVNCWLQKKEIFYLTANISLKSGAKQEFFSNCR